MKFTKSKTLIQKPLLLAQTSLEPESNLSNNLLATVNDTNNNLTPSKRPTFSKYEFTRAEDTNLNVMKPQDNFAMIRRKSTQKIKIAIESFNDTKEEPAPAV
jgi:hypothetical protein